MERSTPELRRSVRLQEKGYYGPQDKSVISYKERLFRVFKRRRQRQCDDEKHHFVPLPLPLLLPLPLPSRTNSTKQPKPNYLLTQFEVLVMVLFALLGAILFIYTLQEDVYQLDVGDAGGAGGAGDAGGAGGALGGDRAVLAAGDVGGVGGAGDVGGVGGALRGHRAVLAAGDAPLMVNYALLSQQATVLRSRSSPTYFRHGVLEMIQWLLCSKHLFVLRPDSPLIPGYCWPFAGDKGHLHIQLAQNIQITHVTLGHITKTQSPTGETTSAPKHFAVYGKMTLDGTEQLLGRFFYDTGEPGFQTFAISGGKGVSFKHVRLQVESNWGNTEYTCLYNFKVHGTPAPPVGQVTPPQQGQCH